MALYTLMHHINPERIVTGTVVELDHLFANGRFGLNRFSRLTHLRAASRLMVRVRRAWLRVTHLLLDLDLDYEDDVEEQHARVARTLASLLVPARVPKLQRVCVRISDSARAVALRKALESYPPLQGESRLWLAVTDDEHPEFMDPFEDEYWLLGTRLAALLPVGLMTPDASFGDLPVELAEYILLFAKDLYALRDKSTLANLTRVSRAIHALVQPVIAETVTMDSSNVICVCAEPGAFKATRCLVVSLDLDDAQKHRFCAVLASTPAFGKLELFSGPLSTLYDVLNVCSPTRVVVASLPVPRFGTRLAHEQMQHLSEITHLRGKGLDRLLNDVVTSFGGAFGLRTFFPNISHVVFDVDDVLGWRSIVDLLPRLLTLPKIERVCLRISPNVNGIRFATIQFARTSLSDDAATRLWIDVRTTWQDDSNTASSHSRQHAAFDDAHWLAGEPLRQNVAQPNPGLATL
ncbi:hypothetical protein EXIGLDRAFT_695362 [Exidia glandulosa HHB12029]|uniref:Uncharacterized protein n=1 Tax=Exidia glandulosa HHB12029 TaxID=1314781 RepID=A0A165FXK8_EXIGL|nr:hypothetical protein EXIGLDRAFT_695362 [Exidia glandulosa HHB12029]